MAPKVKITNEMIINAAMEFVEQNGYDALTVRSIAASLSCSTQPIYSCFSNMDVLKAEVCRLSAEKCFEILFKDVNADDFLCSFFKSFLEMAVGKPSFFRSVFVMPYSGNVDLFEQVKLRFPIDDIFGAQGKMYDLKEKDIRQIFDRAYCFALGYAVILTGGGAKSLSEDNVGFLYKTVRDIVSGSFLSYGY